MIEQRYSLKELAELTEIEPRTIRWYISEGLLRGPEARGRKAYYTEHHLKRLRTIRLLKDTYRMPLERIRKYLLMARDNEDIEVVPLNLVEEEEDTLPSEIPLPEWVARPPSRIARRLRPHRESEPLSYLRAEALAQALPPTPLENLLEHLKETLGKHSMKRRAKGVETTNIDITPDIGLVIRGEHPPREMAQFEMLADYLREILIGGSEKGGPKDEPDSSPPTT